MKTIVCLFASLCAALLSPFVPALAAQKVAGVEVPAPLAPQTVSEVHWGVTVDDPYRFLENVSDPLVAKWMRAQADATVAILAKIPARDALLARIREIEAAAPGSVGQVDRSESGRIFFTRREPSEDQFKLVWRDGPDGKDTVMVDPEALSKAAGKPVALQGFAVSPDGRLVAYSLQSGGGEIGTLHIADVQSGREIVPPLDRIRFASASWLADSTGLFYARLREGFDKLPASERFGDRETHFLSLGTHERRSVENRLVFSPSRNPELKLPSYASGFQAQIPGTNQAAMMVFFGVERFREVYVAPLDAAKRGTAQWRKVAGLADSVTGARFTRDWIYLVSTQNAPRGKVVRVPLANPDFAKAETVIAPSNDVVVNLGAAREALYVTLRRGAAMNLVRISHRAADKLQDIATPDAGNIAILDANPEVDGVILSLGGWTRVAKPYLLSATDTEPRRLALAKDGAFDAPADIEAREIKVKSHDGVEVPVSVLVRKDVKLDGSNPAIVYGYGAYGTTEDPFFNPRIYAWLERGGVYAFAHVRGSGLYGEAWRLAGRKATKPNTWKDGIAVGEWLAAHRYTAPSRMGIFGGSAGGIFVGRAITERPDLFAAAVPAVGVMDTVRTEASANGVANVPEFGTVKREDEFKALLAMSSYHHLRKGTRYPGVMLVHGVNDIRVDVWQSAKFASQLAATTASERPVLMRLDYAIGHGQGSTRAQAQATSADIYSFFLWQFGVPEYQPR